GLRLLRGLVLRLRLRRRPRRVGPEQLRVALGELTEDLVVEVVEAIADVLLDALVVRLGRERDVGDEALPEILLRAALFVVDLVVELDLADREAREPARGGV